MDDWTVNADRAAVTRHVTVVATWLSLNSTEAVFSFSRSILARMPATSRACRARGIWRTSTHGQTGSTRHTPQQTAGRPIGLARGKLNGEVARHSLARMSGVSARMSRSRWRYELTASVEFKLMGRSDRPRSGHSAQLSPFLDRWVSEWVVYLTPSEGTCCVTGAAGEASDVSLWQRKSHLRRRIDLVENDVVR